LLVKAMVGLERVATIARRGNFMLGGCCLLAGFEQSECSEAAPGKNHGKDEDRSCVRSRYVLSFRLGAVSSRPSIDVR
jgi:hypothetical protein